MAVSRAPVDASPLAREGGLDELADLLSERRAFVLTGAGCSTESGIPDYRDDAGGWKRRPPIQLREFVGSEAARRRYWARSLVGWQRVDAATPNAAHDALATLETLGRVHTLVTQNVDGLHQCAGSRRVIDLHGRLDRVECLDCGGILARAEFQAELTHRNPHWRGIEATDAPDGDADLDGVDYESFQVPSCRGCGGLVKPSVVFFGETVSSVRVKVAYERLAACDLLLVVGSSLMVWSGYRFVRAAVAAGLPVVVLGLGRTRAEGEAAFRLSGTCGELLAGLVSRLGALAA